jgi:hypothetical protein
MSIKMNEKLRLSHTSLYMTQREGFREICKCKGRAAP